MAAELGSLIPPVCAVSSLHPSQRPFAYRPPSEQIRVREKALTRVWLRWNHC